MNEFVMNVNLSSPLVIGNKSISERQERICLVAEKIIANSTKTLEQLRKEIATEFFITMRCSLDYLTYANLLIEKYKTASFK